MKLILNLCLLSFLLFSCEQPTVENDLIGSWKWVESTGGIAGVTIRPKNGETRIISFDAKGNFEIVENDQRVVSSHFQIHEGKSILSEEKVPLISFEDESQLEKSFVIVGDTLYLSDEVYDGFTSKYVRYN